MIEFAPEASISSIYWFGMAGAKTTATPARWLACGGNMCEVTWRDLCEAIIEEQDPERLFALADQLQEVLDRDGLNRQRDRSEN